MNYYYKHREKIYTWALIVLDIILVVSPILLIVDLIMQYLGKSDFDPKSIAMMFVSFIVFGFMKPVFKAEVKPAWIVLFLKRAFPISISIMVACTAISTTMYLFAIYA